MAPDDPTVNGRSRNARCSVAAKFAIAFADRVDVAKRVQDLAVTEPDAGFQALSVRFADLAKTDFIIVAAQ
jgi:hypothetical protein